MRRISFNMPINIKTILILICLPIVLYSQDTINFKLFDSLKTKTEDSHEVTAKRRQLDSSNYTAPDTAALRKLNLDSWYKGNQVLTKKDTSSFKKDPDNFDIRLFRKINNSQTPFKTKVFNTFDNSMVPVALMLPTSLFIYSRVKKNTFDENSAYLLTASEFTNLALTFGIKIFIKRERPLNSLSYVNTKGMPFLDVYSFPSGHTSTTFAMATTFALRYPKYPQVYAPMYLWGLITAYGRPYFGLHYPSDLLAGAIIGSGSSILIYSLRKELFRLKNQVLGEDKTDEGSIESGVLTFFGASFAVSAIFSNFIIKSHPDKRLFISPWMDNKRGGLNVKWKL